MSFDIAAKFASAIAAFTPIVGPPTDDDLRNIWMVFLNICLSIDLAGSTPGKVTVLILVDAVYRTTPGSNGVAFDEQENALAEYDPAIDQNTAVWQQRKLEAIWSSKLENRARTVGTKHGLRQFLLHAFEDTYYIQLCDEHRF